jgi:hypothetical protein
MTVKDFHKEMNFAEKNNILRNYIIDKHGNRIEEPINTDYSFQCPFCLHKTYVSIYTAYKLYKLNNGYCEKCRSEINVENAIGGGWLTKTE